MSACIGAGLVGGEGFAVDASLIVADANKQRSTPGPRWNKELDAEAVSRATKNSSAGCAAGQRCAIARQPSGPY